MPFRLALSLFTLCLLFACGGGSADTATPDAAAPDDASTPQASAPQASNPPAAGQPSDAPFGVMSSRDNAAPPPAAPPIDAGSGLEIQAPGATFTLPEAWVRQTPSSAMRLAQASIPGSGGDAQLTVFYFGPGGGGGVEANLDRWIGQVDLEPGTTPTRDGWADNTHRVTWIDVIGTIKPSTMGVGPTTPQPGSRLLGAVIEGAGGPWFFKATGPAATLDEQREAFLGMLRSAKVGG